jgi:inosine-uridine nucleoside N-ribohydrolase
MLRQWTGVQKKLFASWGGPEPGEFVAFLHDPLTVQALIDPAPLRFETLRIVPTVERGMLRTLEAPAGAGLGCEMRVATGVDAAAARDIIVSRLASL